MAIDPGEGWIQTAVESLIDAIQSIRSSRSPRRAIAFVSGLLAVVIAVLVAVGLASGFPIGFPLGLAAGLLIATLALISLFLFVTD